MDMLDSPDGVPDSRLFHSEDKIVVQFVTELFQLMPSGYDFLRWSFGGKVSEHLSGRFGVGSAPVNIVALMQARDPLCNLVYLLIFAGKHLRGDQVADSFSVFKELRILCGDPQLLDDRNGPLQYSLRALIYERNTTAWLAHI